ncbi:TetR/AcrR family transcriptional regulator [Methylocystis heyeri]|nr:TetR/AcrR family transcriptional regulator [Methylocystis heyeri]
MSASFATDNGPRRIPRGQERRSQLVVVAEEVFLEHGFSNSTMQQIASRAGASKETLYRHFANKETLFAEVVSRKASRISGPESGLEKQGPPREILFSLGLNLARRMVEPETLALVRLAIAETPRNPGLGAILYEKGPGTTLNRLADYLHDAAGRGELKCPNPKEAARLFLGAVATNYRLVSLLDPSMARPSEEELQAHVNAAVDMFLCYFGTRA